MNKQVTKSFNKYHFFLIHPLSRHNCDVKKFSTKQVLSHWPLIKALSSDMSQSTSPNGCKKQSPSPSRWRKPASHRTRRCSGICFRGEGTQTHKSDRRPDSCHAVADAHGLQAVLRLAAQQLVDQLGHQDGAGRAAAGVVPSERICQTIRLPFCRFAS